MTIHRDTHCGLQEHKTERDLLLLLGPASFSRACDWPARIISSPGTMFTRWHSSMQTQWFTVPPCFLPSRNCLPPCALSPSLTFSLIWEFFWEQTKFTTQLVLIKTRQRGDRARDREIKCSFDKASFFVYCQTSTNLFLDILYGVENVCFRDLIICSFAHFWIQLCTMFRLMNFSVVSRVSIKKSRADTIYCLVFPILQSPWLYCVSSKPTQEAHQIGSR